MYSCTQVSSYPSGPPWTYNSDTTYVNIFVSQPKKLRKNEIKVDNTIVTVEKDGSFSDGNGYNGRFSNGDIFISPIGGMVSHTEVWGHKH